jgi:hypothetical protein
MVRRGAIWFVATGDFYNVLRDKIGMAKREQPTSKTEIWCG